MDGFTACALAFLAFLYAVFWFGGFTEETEAYKACLDKKEVTLRNVKFACVPKTIIVNGKEVQYQ